MNESGLRQIWLAAEDMSDASNHERTHQFEAYQVERSEVLSFPLFLG